MCKHLRGYQQPLGGLKSSLSSLIPTPGGVTLQQSVQWSQHSGKIWKEPAIVCKGTQVGLQLRHTTRSGGLNYCFHFVWVAMQTFRIHPMTQVDNRRGHECTLALFQSKPCLLHAVQHFLKCCQMLFVRPAHDQDVIQVHHYSINALQEALHHPLKDGWSR